MKIEKIEEKKGSFSKVLLIGVIILIILLIITYLPIVLNWENLYFAVNKPNIVRAVRLQYEQRQRDVDGIFLKTEKTSEEKLIDAVTEQIKK